ncbi:MAG: Xaa-Pro peptidase family protein [Pseudomonadota bacterium]
MSVNDPNIPQSEYDRRWNVALAALSEAGLDGICITSRQSLLYFTGYDGRAADMTPFPLIIAPGRPRTIVVRFMDRLSVLHESIPLEVETYFAGREDCTRGWAETLRKLDLGAARIGLELDNWGLAPRDLDGLREALPDLQISDVTPLVGRLLDLKSDVEINCLKRAQRVTDVAYEAFYEAIVPGATEASIENSMRATMEENGANFVPVDTNLLIGERTILPHGFAGENKLKPGDPVTVETGAFVSGYAGGMSRTALYGENAHVQRLHDAADGAVRAAIEAARPGAVSGDVDEAGRSVVRAAGYGDAFHHRIGYSIGLGWNNRCAFSVCPDGERKVEESMVLHLICFLYDHAEKVGAVTSDSVIIGATGNEILSRLPRDLRRIAAV